DIVQGPEARGVEPRWVEVPRGAVAFHHSLTIHLASANRTARPRRVDTKILFPDGAARRATPPPPRVRRAANPIGAPTPSAGAPLVWPLADGEMPSLPPRPKEVLWGWPPPLS